jgi:hypothetical protein
MAATLGGLVAVTVTPVDMSPAMVPESGDPCRTMANKAAATTAPLPAIAAKGLMVLAFTFDLLVYSAFSYLSYSVIPGRWYSGFQELSLLKVRNWVTRGPETWAR